MLKIEKRIEEKQIKEIPRTYLGLSQIGKLCPRSLWYNFRWFNTEKSHNARMERLFQRGHKEEPIILNDLKETGIKIISTQKTEVLAQGHIKGSNDGILTNVPELKKKEKVLFECKTSNEKNFNILRNKNCIKDWNMTYYIQAQTYMYAFKLKFCLFVVVNKNNDERFYELIEFNKKHALFYLERGIDIINSAIPPNKIGDSEFYYCKYFCDNVNICQFDKKPSKNCRTCEYLKPIKKGKWFCQKRKEKRSIEKQKKSCKKYSRLN